MFDKEKLKEALQEQRYDRAIGLVYSAFGADNADELAEGMAWISRHGLPEDRDGNLVNIGDRMRFGSDTDKVFYLRVGGYDWLFLPYETPGGYRLCERGEKVEPDSQERIDADAKKSDCDYFGRENKDCEGCPAEHEPCNLTVVYDLLRRQRELDARQGGTK